MEFQEKKKRRRFKKGTSNLLKYSSLTLLTAKIKLLVTVTHCNDFTDLTVEHFYFLIGTFACETADPQKHFLFMILYSKSIAGGGGSLDVF